MQSIHQRNRATVTALQRRGVDSSSHDELEEDDDDDDGEVASLDDNDSTSYPAGRRRKDIANSDHNETEGYCSSNDVNPSFQYTQANTKDISLQISPSRIMPDGQGFLLNGEYEE